MQKTTKNMAGHALKISGMVAVMALATMGMGAVLSESARADDWRSGLYIKGGASWNAAKSQSYNTGAASTSTRLKDGYGFTGAVGYEHQYLRSELELSYRDNDVKRQRLNGADVPGVSGGVDSTALMLNGYYDIDTGSAITPYIGAGIGAARVRADYSGAGGAVNAKGKDTVFAYQVMGGAEYALDSRVSLFGEYRYFATQDIDVRTSAGNKSSVDYDNHSLGLGVRYRFN